MFQTYIPSKILQPYVAFYFTVKFQKADYDQIISEFCLPSGYAQLGFHLCGSFYLVQKNEKQELPRFYVMGQQTHKYFMNSNSDSVELYGVTFKPTGLWHFFGLNMPTITNSAIETQTLLKNTFLKFPKEFYAEQSAKTRIQLIEKLVLKIFLDAQPQLNIIDSAIQMINECYGCCSIKELIGNLGISERYFEKKFKNMVGITPTAYKRIVRFNFMFTEIKTDAPIDCKALSALYNYYDFSHFSKDFKKYCGVCPSKFHINQFNFLQELMVSKAWLFKP